MIKFNNKDTGTILVDSVIVSSKFTLNTLSATFRTLIL